MGREVISARDLQRRGSDGRGIADFFRPGITGGLPEQSTHGPIGTHAAGDDLIAEVNAYREPSTSPKELPAPDTYTNRVLKYVPAEVVALFLTLDALVRSSSKIPIFVYWGVFIFGILATYLYLWRIAKVRKPIQLHISAFAFCVWVFAIGGPFTHLSWYDPLYGGLLLPIYTFLVALIEA